MKQTLGKVFGGPTGHTVAPEIACIVMSDSLSKESAEEIVKGAGFSIENYAKSEDVHVFRQDTKEDSAEKTVIQMSDDIALVMVNMKKGLDTYPDSTSFAANIGTAGFYPGLRMGLDLFFETVCQIACKSASPEAAGEAISVSLNELKKYVGGLVSSLPAEAFHMETYLMSDKLKKNDGVAAVEDESLGAPAAPEVPADAPVVEATAESVTEEVPAEAPTEVPAVEAVETETPAVEATATDVPAVVAAVEPAADVPVSPPAFDFAAFASNLSAKLEEVTTGLGAKISEMAEKLNANNVQIAALTKSACDTERLLTGKVTLAMPEGADPVPVQKSEVEVPPLMDTGIHRKQTQRKAEDDRFRGGYRI